MALIQCPICDRDYSNELSSCPHCNYSPVYFKCPECGRLCKKEDASCSYCGIPLDNKELVPAAKEDLKGLYAACVSDYEKADTIEGLKNVEEKLIALGSIEEAPALAAECRERIEALEQEANRKEQYETACGLMASKNIQSYSKAHGILEGLTGYENADELRRECAEFIRKEKEESSKKKKKVIGIIAIVIVAMFAVILIASPCTLLGHKYDEGKITKEANCGDDGIKTFTCERCDSYYEEKVPATGDHKWGDWKTVEKATYSSEGEKKKTCKVCGETKTDTIPQKEHSADYYKDKIIIDTDGKMIYKIYVMDGILDFEGSFQGDGNFIVEILDENQNLEELVCNEIGDYYLDKTVQVSTGWHYMQIIYDGAWNMTWWGTGGN